MELTPFQLQFSGYQGQPMKAILTEMDRKFATKSILLLNEPLINSRILPEGFYLSQGLSVAVDIRQQKVRVLH